MSIFTGSAVAIVTPFLPGGGINLDAFAQMIEFHIKEGTDAIVVCGTTGEPSTMSSEEKREAISFCVKQVNGRIPVIAGTGGNNTANVVADSIAAQEMGVDALLLVTPYYNKCTQNGLVQHFFAVADAVSIPMIVYNVPSRTGVNVLPATMQKLAEHQNIVAIKEASADIGQICEVARLCPDIDIYAGNDDHVTPILSIGGKGVISVTANVVPKMMHDLVASYHEGNVKESCRLQLLLNPLTAALFSEVNPIPAKTGVGLLGYDAGSVRLPLTPLTEPNVARLEAEMKKLNLI